MGFFPSSMLTATLASTPVFQGWVSSTRRSLGRPSRRGAAETGRSLSPSSPATSTDARTGWSCGQASSTWSRPSRFHCQAGRVPPSCMTVAAICPMMASGFCPVSTAQASPKVSVCARLAAISRACTSSAVGPWSARGSPCASTRTHSSASGGFGVFFCFFDHMRHPYQRWMKGILWGKDQLWTSLRLPPCAPLQNFFLRKWAGRTLAGGGAACGRGQPGRALRPKR